MVVEQGEGGGVRGGVICRCSNVRGDALGGLVDLDAWRGGGRRGVGETTGESRVIMCCAGLF